MSEREGGGGGGGENNSSGSSNINNSTNLDCHYVSTPSSTSAPTSASTSTSGKKQPPVIEELNLYCNSRIAKIIASVVVGCFIAYHGFLHVVHGNLTWTIMVPLTVT